MTTLTAAHGSVSLMALEGGLTAIAVAMSFLWPRIGSRFFSPIERVLGRLARRQGLSVLLVGATALVLRLAILPLSPVPHPFINDDFSFLLAADTFSSGRLTNATPAMWQHFESLQITMQPTYMSMYFPAQGLAMAAGKVLLGNPWYGILLSTVLMCAAICWMLQAWLPPSWALLGGLLAVLHLGLFSYWINTYTGAAPIAAMGGALLLGALPRFMKSLRLQYGLLMAVGAILLATSRPYEGVLLCLPVAFVLGRWAFFGSSRPPKGLLLRRLAAPMTLIVSAGVWMGHYDDRVFGSPLVPPYAINRATYARVPYFVWQSPRPAPNYRHRSMQDFYVNFEFAYFLKLHSLYGGLSETLLLKPLRVLVFFAGITLLPPLIMLRRVLKDRRTRFLVACCLVLAVGMAGETFLLVHYVSPFTAAFYAIGLQAMRHLRVWQPGRQPVGLGLTRSIVALCVVLVGLRLYAQPLHLRPSDAMSYDWMYKWYGPSRAGIPRADAEAAMEHRSGEQLAIVRYSPDHNYLDEWVYNAADIAHSKVIWAREMDAASNCELIKHYKDRKAWLVQPDLRPTRVSPYPPVCQQIASIR